MSHNHEPEKAARNHKPAIIAIIVALAVAFIAFLVFTPGADQQGDGIATTPPPADTPLMEADGRGEDLTPAIAPGGNTPADGTTAPAGTVDQPAGGDTIPTAPAAPAPAN